MNRAIKLRDELLAAKPKFIWVKIDTLVTNATLTSRNHTGKLRPNAHTYSNWSARNLFQDRIMKWFDDCDVKISCYSHEGTPLPNLDPLSEGVEFPDRSALKYRDNHRYVFGSSHLHLSLVDGFSILFMKQAGFDFALKKFAASRTVRTHDRFNATCDCLMVKKYWRIPMSEVFASTPAPARVCFFQNVPRTLLLFTAGHDVSHGCHNGNATMKDGTGGVIKNQSKGGVAGAGKNNTVFTCIARAHSWLEPAWYNLSRNECPGSLKCNCCGVTICACQHYPRCIHTTVATHCHSCKSMPAPSFSSQCIVTIKAGEDDTDGGCTFDLGTVDGREKYLEWRLKKARLVGLSKNQIGDMHQVLEKQCSPRLTGLANAVKYSFTSVKPGKNPFADEKVDANAPAICRLNVCGIELAWALLLENATVSDRGCLICKNSCVTIPGLSYFFTHQIACYFKDPGVQVEKRDLAKHHVTDISHLCSCGGVNCCTPDHLVVEPHPLNMYRKWCASHIGCHFCDRAMFSCSCKSDNLCCRAKLGICNICERLSRQGNEKNNNSEEDDCGDSAVGNGKTKLIAVEGKQFFFNGK